jgi:hypothetical protein
MQQLESIFAVRSAINAGQSNGAHITRYRRTPQTPTPARGLEMDTQLIVSLFTADKMPAPHRSQAVSRRAVKQAGGRMVA